MVGDSYRAVKSRTPVNPPELESLVTQPLRYTLVYPIFLIIRIAVPEIIKIVEKAECTAVYYIFQFTTDTIDRLKIMRMINKNESEALAI